MANTLANTEIISTRTCRISSSRKSNTLRTTTSAATSWLVEARPAALPAAALGMIENALPMMMLRGPVRASFAGLV